MSEATEMMNAAGILFTLLAGTFGLCYVYFEVRDAYRRKRRHVPLALRDRRRVRHWL